MGVDVIFRTPFRIIRLRRAPDIVNEVEVTVFPAYRSNNSQSPRQEFIQASPKIAV